ncbi:hypothetical protein [uncultured Fusobacterium sp.]|jgi:hypothetical protein|uniref:hypothetical protein n=1 Tax=uncultured Fusobacterium sp. TaxID=159267 RepID=UPI0020681F7E|nr:hypothetical protein [uncultured Fusobacterium sp.]DAG94633.1 MAG TPA: hypothetical protein [Crassvirales sp.]
MKGYGKDIFNVRVVVRLGKENAKKIAELLQVKTLEDKVWGLTELINLKLPPKTTIFLVSEIIRRKYERRIAIANKILKELEKED